MPAVPLPVEHHRHLIRFTHVAGGWKAAAHRAGKLEKPIESGATCDEAVAAIVARLDAAREAEMAARGPDGFPTVPWVKAAFEALKVTPNQRLMLKAHIAAPEMTLTATQLAAAGGYPSHSTANSQYGNLARRWSEEMEWEPPQALGKTVWTATIATGPDDADLNPGDAEWRWVMRPEIAAALAGY